MFSKSGVLQFEINEGDSSTNLKRIEKLLLQLNPDKGTLLVLPELWAYGFVYSRVDEFAKQTPKLLNSLQKLAMLKGVFFAGSLLEKIETSEKPYNTLFIVGPEGVIGSYRKAHLFSLWKEDIYYSPGDSFKPIETPHGVIGALVCYDLRFPAIASRQCFYGARLIVVSAQWPDSRKDHWRTLLRARAIENQVFVVAANGCGTACGQNLAGHSMIIAPDGRVLADAGDKQHGVSVVLDQEELVALRSRFCSVGHQKYPVKNTDKILDLHNLQRHVRQIQKQGSKIAFTNGCFDILHCGHVDYLEQARNTADCLIVGLNSDTSVKAIKGNSRPVNNEFDRARVLAALGVVDFVVLFDDMTPRELITTLLPDILVKGADWSEDTIVGAAEVKQMGGKVIRIPFEHNVSTTQVIAKIKNC